ncbi:MAG: hydroxymethylpyrimidine/phosphomethylpyrimidine kinase [Bacteroidales bacterium]|nr:hydroxymethylpyrimidine/phosphomethylpyrimidine kinase [Bacteroidales bacterium]
MKTILTIAATDSSSGAGINQDIKVIHDHNCWPITCVTSITLQTFNKVETHCEIPNCFFKKQLNFIFQNFKIDAIKIGVINNNFQITEIKKFLKKVDKKIPVIFDPILNSSSGYTFLKTSYSELLKSLINYITILTPNKYEVEEILGSKIKSIAKSVENIKKLCRDYNIVVILKGGHLNINNKIVTDYIIESNKITQIKHKRLNFKYTHGTGCTFSTALACNLANGLPLIKATKLATQYIIKYYTKVNNQYNFSYT